MGCAATKAIPLKPQSEALTMPSYTWSVRIPDSLQKPIAELARAQHRTAAEQVRFMLERALAAHAIKQSSRDQAP